MRKLYKTTPVGQWKDPEWRSLVRATAEAFLAPDFEPRQRVSARAVARRSGLRVPSSPALEKVDRYALAAAAIRRITDRFIEGAGDDARIRPEYLSTEYVFDRDDPFEQTASMVQTGFYNCTRQTERDKASHVGYFLRRYSMLGLEDQHATAGLIRTGGTLHLELMYYSRATARAFQGTPLTQGHSEAQRVAGAHQMLPIVLGRASQHINTVLDGRSWPAVERMHPHLEVLSTRQAEAAQAAGEAAILRMLGPDGADLFPVVRVVSDQLSPLLKCPAHQRLFDTDSALQTQLHAGINLAADRGNFSPELVVPPLRRF
ncbi:MAG TPA: hypothetical protein VF466_00055 [Candidatus Saccharimonadales bacterium]